MSDWLAGMPESWGPVPVKSIFIERKETALAEALHLTPSQTYGVLPQADYMERTGSRVVQVLEGGANMKAVGPDDFVIHLRSFQGGIEHSTFRGKVSPAYTVLTPKPCLEPRYYRWLLKSRDYIQELQSTTNQLRDGQAIKFKDFASIPLPFPPLEKQRAIADYLDRETAQIDQVIEKNQRLPQLLELRFNGALRRSVTCGLDLDTRLTQTHIPWFGESPAAWDVIPVKQVLQMEKKVVGATWDGIQLLSLTKRGIIQRDIDSGEGKFPESFETYQIVESGDLVFCHFDVDETPRTVGMSKQRGMITSAYTRYKVNNLRALPAYLEFYFKAIDNEKLYRPFYTGLRKVVPKQFFLQSKIALPNLKEQAEIVAYLTDLEESQMAVTKKIQEVNDLLTERRAALITAAVTGQIDVSQGRAT